MLGDSNLIYMCGTHSILLLYSLFVSSMYFICYSMAINLISIWIWVLKLKYMPWWRHQMEIFSALLAICAGNSPVTGEFPTQRPVTRSFDVYFDLRPKERLSKQWWGWWFETLSRSLWRHRNACGCLLLMNYVKLIWYLDIVLSFTWTRAKFLK